MRHVAEVEGLAFHLGEDSVILACKINYAPTLHGALALYSWSPRTPHQAARRWLTIPVAPLAEAVGPSGSVLAVERDGRACADARHNGATFPNLRVLEGEVTPPLVETGLGRPDIVVLDPAREGAGTDVMRALSPHAASVRTVIYVSCDPASFGRDVRVLLDDGWRLTVLRAFDIFPMTEHVELVAALEPPARAPR